MNALYRNMPEFQDLVHEKHPEINLEIFPCNGANTSAYMTDMRKSGQMTDIFFNTVYVSVAHKCDAAPRLATRRPSTAPSGAPSS